MPGSVDIFCFQILINSSPCCSFLSLSVGLACCDLNCIRLGHSAARAPCFSKAGFCSGCVASVFDLCSPSPCPLRRWTLERFAAVLCSLTLVSCTDGQSLHWPRQCVCWQQAVDWRVSWWGWSSPCSSPGIFCWGVEMWRGTRGQSDSMRQTRLNSGNGSDTTPTAATRNDATGTKTDPTLKDVVSSDVDEQ